MLAGKRIVLGVSGSIAAFKVAGWVSALAKEEALVTVLMTESACQFVTPLTMAALSGAPVHSDLFAEGSGGQISHIQLAQEADLFLIAPATAQTIARLAHGMADDLLSATVLATRARILVCPAMNSQMFTHPATQENIAKLKDYGYQVIEPDSGRMACGDEGPGRLPEWDVVREALLCNLAEQDLAGQRVLITAGPTREPLDPVRFLSNPSSGKMGYQLARTARRRGAEVVLVSGPVSLAPPPGVQLVPVQTAQEMHAAVMVEAPAVSIIVKAAAVSDFRPEQVFTEKVKKEAADSVLRLERTPDILEELGRMKAEQGWLLVGFAAESGNLLEEGRRKLMRKNLDLIAVNNILAPDAGFEVETNQLLLLDAEGAVELPLVSKEQAADLLWDRVVQMLP